MFAIVKSGLYGGKFPKITRKVEVERDSDKIMEVWRTMEISFFFRSHGCFSQPKASRKRPNINKAKLSRGWA